MLFNSKYRYYEFFFTHLGQTLSSTVEGLKVKDWLRINIEQLDEDYFDNRSLTIFTADSIIYNSGTLTISVPNGIYKFDTSITVLFNLNNYKSDKVTKEVIDYSRVWNTPLIKKPNISDNVLDAETFGSNLATESDPLFCEIFFGDADFSDENLVLEPFLAEETFTYKDNNVTVNRGYPWVIKDDENKLRTLLPWSLEKANAYKHPYTDYLWKGFTVDTEITNNQTFIGEDEFRVHSLNTSTADYFVKLKQGIEGKAENLFTTDLLPLGLTTVTFQRSSSISKSWVGINRGYTPADFLTDDMKSGKTVNVAVSILTLIELEEDRLLVLVIRELTHLWKYVLNNVIKSGDIEEINPDAVPGFPSNIPRVITDSLHSCYLDSRRATLDNSWLGYALTKAATYLADRKIENRITLSNDLAKILEQLAQFIAGCISPATGLCTPGYDDFGYLIAELDYQASVMASLFLNSYLTTSYSNFIHGRAARLKLNLDSIYELDQISELNTRLDSNLISLYTYLVIYAFVNRYQYRLLDITTKLIDSINGVDSLIPSASIEDITFANYVLDRVSVAYTDISVLLNVYLSSINTPINIDKGLYAIEQEIYPSLLTSSLTILKELDVDIFNNYFFDLLESEAELLTTIWYNSGLRLYPYGYGWIKEEQLRTTTSSVGALIYSAAYATFETACYISLLKSSVSVRNSQGSLLNAWGDSIRRPRPLFMSDFYYREYVAKEMLNPLTLSSSLASYINNNFGEDIIVYNPELPKYIYSLVNDSWLELEIGTSAYTEALLKGNNIEPGFYRKNGNNYVFVKWLDYNCRVYVASIGYYKGLTKEITQSLSTGVKAEIKYYLPFVGANKDVGYFIS